MEKINIAEILKDCPKGMELDCLLYNNVTFLSIDDDRHTIFPIKLLRSDGCELRLTKYGQYANMDDAKCVIFPKNKTTWEGFQRPFKDGDIVATSSGDWIGITTGGESGKFIPTYCAITSDDEFEVYLNKKETWQFHRLATEEEKAKLFDAIKANGYKWNVETKTLEKLIIPKFKVGDRIRHKITNKDDIYEISKVYDDSYGLVDYAWMLYMEYQDNYELVPNKFDITTLKPFDKVLVRNTNKDYWEISMFGHISNHDKQYFMCIANSGFYQCVPYNDETKHLLDTTNDCSDYYKTW